MSINRRILALLREHTGLTATELAAKLDTAPSVVRTALGAYNDAGILVITGHRPGKGPAAKCYALAPWYVENT